MKQIHLSIKLILIFVLATVHYNTLLATHVAGGTMTYRCLGDDRYEISMEFRRDCINGELDAPFDDPANFGVYDSNFRLISFSVEDTDTPGVGLAGRFQIPLTTNDTLIETLTTACNVISGDVCVQTTVYRDTIRLPFMVGGYNIVYQRCCRNISLNNVEDPLNTGSTYWVNINEESLRRCNSSPSWDNWPAIYICAEDSLNYLHSATDPDGDSLVYELCTPSAGLDKDVNFWSAPPGSLTLEEVVWANGFTTNNMFGGGDPLVIDPASGQMYAVPPAIVSQFLIGVCVKEYRNGVLLSEIRRDFEYNVRICGRDPVAMFSPDALQKCNSLEVSFSNGTTSNFLPVDSLDFTWIFDFPNGNLTSNEMTPTFTYPTSGVYDVALIADDGACMDTAYVQVAVATEDDPALSFELEAISCSPDYILNLNAVSSISNALDSTDYMWTIVSGGVTTTVLGPNPMVNSGPDQDVMVTLSVTGPTGCTNTYTETQVLTAVQNPIINFGLDSYNCNSITTIELSSDIQSPESVEENDIVWTILANGMTNTVTGTNPTFDINTDQAISVTLMVTTPNGCTTSVGGDFNIETIPDPAIDFSFSTTNCNDAAILSLSGTATSSTQSIDPNSYTWTITTADMQVLNGNGPIYNQVIGEDQLVTVQLQVSTFEGCTSTISEQIQISTVPFNPQFNDVIVCPGESAVVYANTNSGNTVTISPQPTNLTVDANGNYIIGDNQTTTVYNVTVSNADCTRTEAVTITVDSNPSFAPIPDIVQCGSATVALNPSFTSGYVYQWSGPAGLSFDNASGSPLVSLPSSGDFFVTISTNPSSLCFGYDTVRVNRVELPTIAFSPEREIIYCENESYDISVTSNGTVTWFNENGQVIQNGNNLTIANLQESAIYQVQSVTPEGCMSTDQLEVQFIPAPEIIIDPSSQNQACFGEEITVTLDTDNLVSWSNQAGQIIASGSTLTIPNLNQDTTITITVENDLGCLNTEEIFLEVLDLPETSSLVNERNVCIDVPFSLESDLLQYDITVFDEDGNIVGTGHDIDFPEGISESATFIYEFISADGCISLDMVTVNVFEEIGLQINEGATEQIYCRGFTAAISSSTDVDSDVEWFADGNSIAMNEGIADYLPTGDETIIAIATSSAGCIQADTISLNESFSEGEITGDEVICITESTTLAYTPNEDTAFNISWTPNDDITIDGTAITVSPGETTTYEAIYENADGCLDTSQFTVTVGGFAEAPSISTELSEVCLTQSTELFIDTDSDNTITWTPAGTLDDPTVINPLATPTETTTYTVNVSDQFGCETSNSISIAVVQPTCDERDVFIPNMFTPNFDNLNDVFQVESAFLESMTLTVYNRWGEEVFSSDDQANGWDGTYEGEILEPDVYGYYFSGVCVNGFTTVMKGNVTLIK